jgi:2-polyprenyl-3-methyl-5-hydroxy-6-metoxy-1,4-benzoquinol methylase
VIPLATVKCLVSSERAHWESTYATKATDAVSWYEPRPERSLELIQATGVSHDAGILDVGGGASSLAAQLLGMGYADVAVADISQASLAYAKAELGSDATRVSWIEADVRAHNFGRLFDVWHDRAVFHFMVCAADREGYLEVLRRTLRPGGHLLIATFGPQGPTHCSGLPVQRYRADELQRVLGEDFELISSSLVTAHLPEPASSSSMRTSGGRRVRSTPAVKAGARSDAQRSSFSGSGVRVPLPRTAR